MIKIDALYLMLILETLVFLAAISAFLVMKLVKYRGGFIKLENELSDFLHKQSGEKRLALKDIIGKGQEDAAEQVNKESLSMELDMLKRISGVLKKDGLKTSALWKAFYEITGENIAAISQIKKTLVSNEAEMSARAEEIKNLNAEVKRLTDMVGNKDGEIKGMSEDNQELLADLQNGKVSYEQIVEQNSGLRAKITELESEIESAKNEIAAAKNDYEQLEKEYLVLYNDSKKADAAAASVV